MHQQFIFYFIGIVDTSLQIFNYALCIMHYELKKVLFLKKQTTMNNKVNRQRTADNRYWLKSLVFILLSLAMITSANAQQLQSYSDKNYNEKVQTVLLHPTLDSLAKPVIHLNDMMGQLHLQFDVFANDAPYMYYKFVHCNNDWTQQSDIQQVEYLEGFESDDIENYSLFSYVKSSALTIFSTLSDAVPVSAKTLGFSNLFPNIFLSPHIHL